MSDPTYFYLTVNEYKVETLVPNLVSPLSDSAVKSLILETMTAIDAYFHAVGGGWESYEDDQEFMFPRSFDESLSGVVEVPRPISIATRMIADALLVRRSQGVSPAEIASEGKLGHSYSKKSETIEHAEGFRHWPEEVFGILEPFVRRGGVLALDQTEELSMLS